MDFRQAQGSSGGKRLDPTDPDVAAALKQLTRDFEQRWLDEPVPALAGRTPPTGGRRPHPARRSRPPA